MNKPYVYAYNLSYNGILQYKKFTKLRVKQEYEQTEEREKFNRRDMQSKSIPKLDDSNAKSKEDKRKYKLNKSKVRARAIAFSRLPKSRKNFYFYTITFPQNLNDNLCFEVFNIALTRLRKENEIQDYLWITERQKNQTLHFHLLTNDLFSVRNLNNYVKASLIYKLNRKEFEYNLEILQKYNGVDIAKNRETRVVQNIAKQKDSRLIVSYLTKYITKNNEQFTRLPFHSSHSISKLTNKVSIDQYTADQIWHQYQQTNMNPKVFKNEFIELYFFSQDVNQDVFKMIDEANEKLYRPREMSEGTASPAYFRVWA